MRSLAVRRDPGLRLGFFASSVALTLTSGLLGVPEVRAAPELVKLDAFDAKDAWEVKEWGDPAELAVTSDEALEGGKAVTVAFDIPVGTARGKGIILRRSVIGRVGDFGELVLDVHNASTQAFELALALEADRYYELPAKRIEPGWNHDVRFDLREPKAKAETSGWRHEVEIDRRLHVGSLMLILHAEALGRGVVTLDDLRSNANGLPPSAAPKAANIAPHPIGLGARDETPTATRLYETLELRPTLEGRYLDPYDPDEVALAAEFRSPSGRIVRVEGFLYDGEVTLFAPVERADWRIRFTPNEPGAWTYRILARNRWSTAESGPFGLEVKPSEEQGFVRVDSTNPRYFSLDSGAFFYPIGQNVSWGSDDEYSRILPRMAESGQNWVRIWMSHWSFGIEWKRMGLYNGLGNYNLVNAKRLDDLFARTRALGLQVQLVLDFHGAFSSQTNPEWQNNPYNVRNGGFLENAHAFFTDPRAKKAYQRRLRYIVARWGCQTNLMAWELFNEINFTDDFDKDDDAAWHEAMSRHLKALDPYQHLITTSYYDDFNKKTSVVDSVDYTQYHAYRSRVHKVMANASLRSRELKKPFFFGEFGKNSKDGVDDQDRLGIFLHAGLWSQIMQPAAGGAMPWWWQTHIEPNNLYYHFAAVTRFLQGLDRRKLDLQPVRQRLQLFMGQQTYLLEVMGLQDPETSIFWVCDALGMANEGRPQRLSFEGVRLTLRDLTDGAYDLEVWNTYSGRVVERAEVTAKEGQVEVALPRFANDVAFKLKRRR